jgi:NTP pyrophosphatase (non-canonical NTP hydrolase)
MVMFPLLGLAGEAGDLLSAYKKRFAPGNKKIFERDIIKKELGDILWYLSNIASKANLKLEKVAQKNLTKVKARCTTGPIIIPDKSSKPHEKFPRSFQISFEEHFSKRKNPIVKLFVIDKEENKFFIGDDLTDSSPKKDGYRYHDVFHLAYAAKLGWSPVTRALLKRKRKSNKEKDETEDGGRAIVLEEAISAYIFNEAKKLDFFNGGIGIPFSLLKTIRSLTAELEIKEATPKLWEEAIVEGYDAFRQLKDNKGGKVRVDLDNRKLLYLGSN